MQHSDLLADWEVAPVAVAGVVASSGADARVYHVGNDVGIGHRVAKGAPPRLPEEGAILDVTDYVLHPLPH